MEHPWFKNFNWIELENNRMKPFWEPPFEENYYHDYDDEEEVGKETELYYNEIKNRSEYSKYFEDYSFNEKDLSRKENKIEEKEKEKRNELNKKLRLKYEMTSKIINKLKQEIKKCSFSNFNNINKRNNSLYKNPLIFSNDNTRRIEYPKPKKRENSFFGKTNSYFLYNSQENNLKTSSKFHKSNGNTIDLSTKYNNKEKKLISNGRIKFDNKSIENKNFYLYIVNNKFNMAQKISNKINMNLNSMIKNFYFHKILNRNLPMINQLKKSSSVGYFERIKNIKKS